MSGIGTASGAPYPAVERDGAGDEAVAGEVVVVPGGAAGAPGSPATAGAPSGRPAARGDAAAAAVIAAAEAATGAEVENLAGQWAARPDRLPAAAPERGGSPQPSPSGELDSMARWMERVTVDCCLRALRRGGSARFVLDDEILGRLRLGVTLQGSEVSVEVLARSAVLAVFEALRGKLRRTFVEVGLDLALALVEEDDQETRDETSTPDDASGIDPHTGARTDGPSGRADALDLLV